MSKVKDCTAENVFGDLDNYIIRTNYPNEIIPGNCIWIVNTNCEFEYDSYTGRFDDSLLYAFVVDLELINMDLSGYVPEKSNNGGCYGYAFVKINEVKERGY